ncbi:MAG: hypothetical protein WBA74_20075, partial [Cyclobacteriaceae bacterium]
LNLFDDLGDDNELFFHQIIHQNPALEIFLTKNALDLSEELYDQDILYSPWFDDFKEFISPFLVDVLKKELNIYFNKREWRKAFKLLTLTELLSDYYKSAAFDKLAGSLNHMIVIIGDFARGDTPLDKKNYHFLSHDHFISFMNELPEEFDNYREKLAINLNNLGAQYQKTELKFVSMIFMALRQLNCSDSMKKTIVDNSNILINMYNHDEDVAEESSSNYGCLSFAGVIVLFFILLRACSLLSDDKGPTRDFSFTDYTKTKAEEAQSIALKMKVKHSVFVDRIIEASQKQKDTLTMAGKQKSVPLKPYFAFYEPFTDRLTGGDSILIKNESKYDAVIFGLSRTTNYSIGVAAGAEKYILLDHLDEVNIYLGRDWDQSMQIKHFKRKANLLFTLNNGIFMDTSRSTISQLRQYYQYRSPDKRTFIEREKVMESIDEEAYVFEEVVISDDPELPDAAGAIQEETVQSEVGDTPSIILKSDEERGNVKIVTSKELVER